MSWMQIHGKPPRATSDIAQVTLMLSRPDAQCPRQQWGFELMHIIARQPSDPALGPADEMVVVTLDTMGFSVRDWRQLAGKELRADAAWHEEHNRCHEYGRLRESSLRVMEYLMRDSPEQGAAAREIRMWRAHDFILRFGERDGLSFPVELDAWLLPDEEFWRSEPESDAELARFGEGPPNLRVMATATFTEGWVYLPRCADPVALARRFLREEVAFDGMHRAKIKWQTRRDRKETESREMPGWPATVRFKTAPGEEAEEAS